MEKQWSGSLVLLIESGQALKNKDLFGASDPYVIIRVESKEGQLIYKAQGTTIENNLNPVWNEPFVKHLSGSGPVTITIQVYDEDDVGKDEFIGEHKFEFLPKGNSEEHKSVTLKSKKGKIKKLGTLNFTIVFVVDDPIPVKDMHETTYVFPNGKDSKVVLGPVLLFRGTEKNEYKIAILALLEGEGGETPLLTISPAPVSKSVDVAHLLTFKNKNLWRYSFSIKRKQKKTVNVKYSLNNKEYDFAVPAMTEKLRSIFVSCNGYHEEPQVKPPMPKYHMWGQINKNHIDPEGMGKYHLIIQGGDQVYADPIFHKVDLLKGHEAGGKSIISVTPNLTFNEQVEEFYMNLYIESWSDPDLAKAYASIPSVMMWDDHDIFDGWGSYEPAIMNSPVYSFLGKTADKYFSAFQLGATSLELENQALFSALKGPHKGKSQVYKIDKIGVACLDLRSERTTHQVLTAASYNAFFNWIRDNNDLDHIYLVLSIPIVYNDFDILENVIGATGLGKELEDDLKDHWRTKDHREERKKFLQNLISEADKSKVRITILSGDVHIGCAGIIYDNHKKKSSNAAVIYSLISSAVVNVPPPEGVVHILELTGAEIEKVENDKEWDLKAGLIRFHHDHRKSRYIPGRNFLELLADTNKGVLCRWFSEKQEDYPYELYIAGYTKSQHRIDWNLFADDWKYISQLIGTKLLGFPTPAVYASWKKKK